jgi:hypothetical protein
MMKPDTIAEIYWHVHSQHKSAWTHELDVARSQRNSSVQ